MSRARISVLIFFLIAAIGSPHVAGSEQAGEQWIEASVTAAPIAEAKDFATAVLGDPWDMSEYSDVSQYMNESGNRDVVRNINVSGGIFRAVSAGGDATGQNGWFFTLFAGYLTTIHTGRTGSRTPIASGSYSCLYLAMKVQSPAADYFRAFWFADDRMNTGGAPYGVSNGIPLYPEYGGGTPTPIWKLYKVDLANFPSSMTPWTGRSSWQGLRIDPTIKGNVHYAIDWIRLTNCNSHVTPVTFSPNAAISAIWLRPEGTNRRIRVVTGVNGSAGSYNLDIQGVQPGSYYVGFGNTFTCCITESAQLLTINQTPIVQFQDPSWSSGVDAATVNGNPWDMSSSSDFVEVRCATHGLLNGRMWIDTPPNTEQPPQCRGSTPPYSSDAQVVLSVPAPINPAEYRYLTFRMYDDNPWQFVSQGSIVRWIWTVQGSGSPNSRCYLVSNDIPYDVGWNTYTVDLWDAFEGSAEDAAGTCSSLPRNWRQSSPALELRFDPSENITDHHFYDEIDWIRLTKPITIQRGQIYHLGLNRFFPGDAFNVTLFYTSNPKGQPTQHPLILFNPPTQPPAGPHRIFLPSISNSGAAYGTSADLEFGWDTSTVSPGEYFVCARVSDGINQGTFCSDASVTVFN